MSTPTTPEATTPEADDLDLFGCDHCDFTSEYEDDFHSLGGDRQTEGGLVAYPATCNGCWDDEMSKYLPRRVRPLGTNAP